MYGWVDEGRKREKKKLVARQSMAQIVTAFLGGWMGVQVGGWMGVRVGGCMSGWMMV